MLAKRRESNYKKHVYIVFGGIEGLGKLGPYGFELKRAGNGGPRKGSTTCCP